MRGFRKIDARSDELLTLLENELLEDFVIGFVRTMIQTIDAKSQWTRGHSEIVATFSQEMARALGLEDGEIKKITLAALLHDVGKIGTFDTILEKRETLKAVERNDIKKHAENGVKILKNIRQFESILPIIRHHHEHYDGSGYPDRLKGNDIPLGARIICVADAFDAMTSERPYRPAITIDRAREELLQRRGTQFDPEIVDTFIALIDEFRTLIAQKAGK